MKYCPNCSKFFREQIMTCQSCDGSLNEVDLTHALQLTKKESFRKRITGYDENRLHDSYKQYHIRSYLKNRSLFLDFDLFKNRLKHGKRLKRFFIAPVHLTSVLNLPWFIFNIINTNLFHLNFTEFCPKCNCKCIPGQHDQGTCDYNLEYFNILNDILSGRILENKEIYMHYAAEKRMKGLRSAYNDLFRRNIYWEIFWDLLSIGFSIMLWIFVAVNVSFPMFMVLVQRLQQFERYQGILTLR